MKVYVVSVVIGSGYETLASGTDKVFAVREDAENYVKVKTEENKEDIYEYYYNIKEMEVE